MKKVDSLLNVLTVTSNGLQIIDVKVELTYEYLDIDNQLSLKFSNEAYKLATEVGDSARIVKTGRITGQILRRVDRLQESINLLSELAPIAKRNGLEEDYERILNGLAVAYTFMANYDKALEYNFQCLVIREAKGDKADISITLNNIGLVYFKLRNYDEALKYYNHALTLRKEVNYNYELDRLYVNIGLCFVHLKKFNDAIDNFNRGFSVCGVGCDDQFKISGYFGLGVSSFYLASLEKAEKHFKVSYGIAKRIDDKRFQTENLVYLASIAIEKERYDSAAILLKTADSLAQQTGYFQLLMDTYKQFSKLYTRTEDFKNAALYQSKLIQLNDKHLSEDLISNIAKIQTNYAERENKAIIATKEEVIQRQHSLNIAIGIIAALALLLIFVLVYSNRARKRVNLALTEANEIIELKNQELDKKVAEKTADLEVANESLSQVNEELDNFIYKTSHDIRGPLASLKGICNVALMDVKDLTALDYLRKLDITAEHLNTILTRLLIINQINNSAMKPELINFDAIVDEVLLLERKKGLPGSLNIRRHIQENTRFYSDKEFIRIIMENLIDNAIKFYNDSHRIDPFVDIFVEQTDDEIKIRVVDNGIGISEVKPDKIFQMFSRASERSGTGGIGLYITKTATEKLGGSVGLKTTPEGHTQFYVKFPLKQQWFEDPAWSS